jgi:hypothetical protein
MPRPAKTIPSITKNIALPEDLVANLEIELFSELEGKIPYGAHSVFFSQLLRDYFARKAAPCSKCGGTGLGA